MAKQKIISSTHLILKAIIYSLVPVVFFLVVTTNSPILFGIRSFVVQTGSMEPNIPVGSVIFSVPQKTYELGDIILFKDSQGRTISHRINKTEIKKGTMFFQTKGDANNSADIDLVLEGSVIGREVFLLPSVGRISAFIKTVPGFILILGLPTLLFIGFEILNIKTELEKEIEKKLKERMGISLQYES